MKTRGWSVKKIFTYGSLDWELKKEKKSKNYQEKDFVGVTDESIANLLGGLTGNE